MKGAWVYILTNRPDATLYIGVTANLPARMVKHRERAEGFVQRYGLTKLVHAEAHDRIDDAIAREKAMKKWRRAWKVALIEQHNPGWEDLYRTMNA